MRYRQYEGDVSHVMRMVNVIRKAVCIVRNAVYIVWKAVYATLEGRVWLSLRAGYQASYRLANERATDTVLPWR